MKNIVKESGQGEEKENDKADREIPQEEKKDKL